MRRAVLLVVVALTVLWPAFKHQPADGFPISSYPMFARRSGPIVAISTAVGIDRNHDVHRLGPRAIAGSDEVVLAAEQVRLAVQEGPGSSRALCREVADRVHDLRVVAVEVRTETRDAVADIDADGEPLAVVVHSRCDVSP